MQWLSRTVSVPVAGITVLTGQVLRAARRTDIPSLGNQDVSGVFGDVTAPQLRVALLGDSTITAPGVEPLDHAWPRRVARRLSVRYHVELASVARGGSKAHDVLTEQLAPALALQPDLALVSVGANDALRFTPVARYETEMDEILGRLAAEVAGVGVLGVGDLGTVPRLPTLTRGLARVRARALDRAVTRVGARHRRVVKATAWGASWGGFAKDPDSMFAADLFHASGAGHAVLAGAFDPVVDELLSRLELSRDGRLADSA